MMIRGDGWKRRGLVCGVEWSVFRKTVDLYRKWLDKQYGGAAGLRQQLVFAHNDVTTDVILKSQHIEMLIVFRLSMATCSGWSPLASLHSFYL